MQCNVKFYFVLISFIFIYSLRKIKESSMSYLSLNYILMYEK